MTFGTDGVYPKAGVASLFDHVREHLSADVGMGNLESSIGTGPTTKCSRPRSSTCFAYQAPPETAQALRDAGFSVVNMANNHSNDAGPAGAKSTQEALTEAGIAWTGLIDQITYLPVKGVTVAVLGFAPYTRVANALDVPAAVRLVTEARQNADLVVVLMHLGAEGNDKQHVRPGNEYAYGEDRGDSIHFSHSVIDAGADLVVGSGPHVLRGMQWYKGRLIAYSLGNFTGYHTLAFHGAGAVSGILHVTLDNQGQFVAGNLTPVLISSQGTPSIDPAGTAIDVVNTLSSADFADSGGVRLADDGAIVPPQG